MQSRTPVPSPAEREIAEAKAQREYDDKVAFNERLKRRRSEGMTTETFKLEARPRKKKRVAVNAYEPSNPFTDH